MPAFNNDEIIIPSFIEKGVTEEDAYNYSAIGCVEVAIPGKWGYRCTGMSFLNFAKSFMIALNDGVDIDSGIRVCQGVGHFRDMKSFDEVLSAWDKIIHVMTSYMMGTYLLLFIIIVYCLVLLYNVIVKSSILN